MKIINKLCTDAFVYGIGAIASKGIGFLLLPIYTKVFDPSDYGTIEMLAVVSNFIGMFIMMGLDASQSRYFYEHQDLGVEKQAVLVSSILQWRLVCGTTVVVIATLVSPVINAFFFHQEIRIFYFAISFAGILFSQIMSQSAEIFRLLYKPWRYVSVTLFQALLSAVISLILILILDYGLVGYILSTAISSLIASIIGWYYLRQYINFSVLHWKLWPKVVGFGVPLLSASIAGYFMDTADRWFIQFYKGVSELGIYAIGAKFSMIMLLFVDIFRKAWWPIAMEAINNNDRHTIKIISQIYSGCYSSILIALTLISPWLIKTFAANAYFKAWPIVGILGWQAFFYGFHSILSIGIWKKEKTILIFYFNILTGFICVFLNWILVPYWSFLGAAIATSVAYGCLDILILIACERIWPINFPIKLFAFQISTSILFTVWITSTDPDTSIGFKCLLGSLLIIVLISSSIPVELRLNLIKKITRQNG